ncbi:MAG: hypothetical protein ACP5IZ_11290, partial [Thermoprotei archaeon]
TAIWTNPPRQIQTIKTNIGQIYKETTNGTLYLTNTEIPPHQTKTILDIIIKIIPQNPSENLIPDNAAIIFSDGYTTKWKLKVEGTWSYTEVIFLVKDTEYVPLTNYVIRLDVGTPYEKMLFTNSSGYATTFVAWDTWFHITIPATYPSSGIDARDYAFTWVSAKVQMKDPITPTQDGPITPPALPPPLNANFPSYTQQPLDLPTNGTGVGTWQNDFWLYTAKYDKIYIYIFYKTIVVVL